jgi:branched-chain amino acid transport system permease protein
MLDGDWSSDVCSSDLAAILGGFGSFPGAILGGLSLGLLESLSAGYVSSAYKDVVAFVVLLLVLCVRPKGLLGK